MLSVTWMRGHECPVYPLSANSASAWNSFCTGAQYYDAKWVQKAVTRLVLVETLGGIAPPTKQFLHVFGGSWRQVFANKEFQMRPVAR